MKPEEIQKLLGGYATGTLTPEEQKALFEAALHDQALFDALAQEQTLHDLLRDPSARAHVLAAIDERPRRWWQVPNRWVLAGTVLAACLAVAGIFWTRQKPAAPPVLVAVERPESRPPVPQPVVEPPRPVAEAVTPAPAKRKAVAAPPQGEVLLRSDASQLPQVKQEAVPVTKASPMAPPAPTPPPVPAAVPPKVLTAPQSAVTLRDNNADLVTVTGATAEIQQVQVQNARSLFYATPGVAGSQFMPSQGGPLQTQSRQLALQSRAVGGLVAVPNPGIKWTALRKQPDGLFTEVDTEQIKAGDVIKLRLVPNADGYLSVLDGTNTIASDRRAVRLQPVETPEITSASGTKELTVLLSRQPQVDVLSKDQPAKKQRAAGLVLAAAAGEQLSQADRAEHAVYEVKTGSNLPTPVLVKIKLNFQ